MQLRIGIPLEVDWGHFTFLFVYVVTGIYSQLCSAYFLPENISVGCSGSIMGILGAWFVWSWITWDPKRELINRITEMMVLAAVIVVVICQSWMPMVDYACHAGGLIMGIPLGMALFFYRVPFGDAGVQRRRTLITGIVGCLALWFAVFIPFIKMDTSDLKLVIASY